MTAVLLTSLTGQFFDNNGDPLNGGLIYSYVAGTAFGTPLATYTNATGSTPAANPVVLNSAGRADIWGAGTYDFKITDSVGNIIDTISSVTAIFGSGDMTKAIYDPANIAQQLVGTTAVQTLTNKTLSTGIVVSSSVTGTTQTAGDNSTKISTTAYVDNTAGNVYQNALGGISPTGSSANPGVMMGISAPLTPRSTGKILVNISGFMSSNGTGGVVAQIRYGTGTAPVNGAAAAGTAIGAQQQYNPSITNARVPFALTGIITGLTLATAIWVDTQVGNAGANTASITNVSVSLMEV